MVNRVPLEGDHDLVRANPSKRHKVCFFITFLNRSPLEIQSDLSYAATLRTFKSGRLIEVGRLIEAQFKLDRKGYKHDFIAFM